MLAGHSISGFLLSELNFSAVALCLLSYLKDLHIPSCNSRSFKIDFFYPVVSAESGGGVLGAVAALQ